jgi:hypothetical protein
VETPSERPTTGVAGGDDTTSLVEGSEDFQQTRTSGQKGRGAKHVTVRDSLHDVPWRRVGVEFLAIFTAVLLSFIADDRREHLGERRVEGRLLEGLVSDLSTDTVFFERGTIPNDSLALQAGEWLQANWRRADPPADSVNWALNGMYRGMAYAPARTEYEAARNSARLDLIRSAEVRKLINSHYEQTHGILQDVWGMNLRFHFEWVAAVGPYVEFAPTFRQPIGELSEYTQDIWPVAELRASWRVLQQDDRAHAALAQTNTFRRLVIAWQRANVREIKSLQNAIQVELNGGRR